ncbi:protein kinase family protein [Streptomyces sp. WMMC500]|uniref:protein kinase family protein n=1 Tax=Streptomyces sp. WMMC500 TaxID=3015154 RepID=UPI00248B29A1|nr:protein kinase family protein [Streptomyces sp. WMMC500]WBB57913.1 protein kinase family protein [Streptomyces sp. WMMC500]
MAERSTAAVDGSAADRSDAADTTDAADTEDPTGAAETPAAEAPAAAAADPGATDTGAGEPPVTATPAAPAAEPPAPDTPPRPPRAGVPVAEMHSGHKLATRYRLEECVTRLDGFSSWRAVDEKLRRAVGVHVLAAGHDRADAVLDAARSAALIGDPRFVQVLDAVEEDDVVYVVHEWLPDATELSTLLAGGAPMEPHEAYELVTQVSQALAAAHRKDLAHLRLTPSAVLRTGSGQWRIRGLSVHAALHGAEADDPGRTDTEAVGALLYAALTGRWPYEGDAYGLAGLPKHVGLIAPDQVRAGVHRGLSELAMRALAAGSPAAAAHPRLCTTPAELSGACAELPRIRPPERQYPRPAPYQQTTYQQGYAQSGGHPGGPAARPAAAVPPPAPPTLPGRTGKAVKWAVSVLLIVALALGSWQLADALINHDGRKGDSGNSAAQPGAGGGTGGGREGGKPVEIESARDFDPYGTGSESPSSVPAAYDADPSSYWETKWYTSAAFGNLKEGVGLVLDLGEPKRVGSVKVSLIGDSKLTAMATPQDAASTPTDLSGFEEFDDAAGTNLTLKPTKPVVTQYVLLWLTEIPPSNEGNFRGKISDIQIRS